MRAMASPLKKIEQLRKHRASKAKDLSISSVVAEIAHDSARTHKRMGELIALWEELVPVHIAEHTSLSGLRKGVLHVIVDSSSAAFELDRLLRSGLTNEIRSRFRGSMVRVKTRIGKFNA